MLLGTQAFAQLSVNGGYINSQLSRENSKSLNANGAYAGISFNIPVAGGLAFAPGIYYSLVNGENLAYGALPIGKMTEHAINVPVYVNYGLDLARDTRFFIFGGPTVQYALANKVKVSDNINGSNFDEKDYNRMNVYLGGGIGFQVAAIQITVGYDYGLMNQYNGDNAIQAHRSNIKIGAGFLF